MIKQLTVTNHKGESLVLPLGNPRSSGFSVRGIDGLGPPKADINMTEVLSVDGSYFNSARLANRNIVLTLGFESNPNESIEQLRRKSYRYFPIKQEIDLEIETDGRSGHIYGRVESNNPNVFSKDQTTQISIVCPDAYFYALDSTITEFTTSKKTFEFPFSNESTTEDLIEFGTVEIDIEKSVLYEGDADTGIIIYLRSFGAVENFEIYNQTTGESMFIDTDKLETLTGDVIIAGDQIVISTIKGSKYIYLYRNGEVINILNCLSEGSDWFQIVQGDNVFNYTATSGIYNLTLEIHHHILYEGL